MCLLTYFVSSMKNDLSEDADSFSKMFLLIVVKLEDAILAGRKLAGQIILRKWLKHWSFL